MEHLTKKIYILHGWAYTTEKWEPFLEGLKGLGFEPVFLKIPGLTAPLDRPWMLDDYVEWLHATLANEKEPVTLMAHSNGGRISISFTAKYPAKVKNLILIGSAGVYHRDFKTELKRGVFKTAAKLGGFMKKNETLRRMLYKLAREKDYRDASPMMRETMRALISVDVVPLLSKISCPVLLVWGKEDKSTPLADGKVMEKTFPNAELAIIDTARHSPQFTHVKEVLNTIQTYYAKKNF